VDKEITKQIAQEYLGGFKNRGVDTLILACTHYPILKKVIQKTISKQVKIINPAESLAKELKLFLNNQKPAFAKATAGKGKKDQFFFSDQPYNLKKISKLYLNKEIKPIIINEII